MEGWVSVVGEGIGAGVVSGLLAWGGLRVQLKYMNRDIEAANSMAKEARDNANKALTILEERKKSGE